jgi:proteasome lid subunit RPN8/RPN11
MLIRKNIFIKEKAFLSMILSAIEVYHQESLGVLLGHRTSDGFVIEYAIPYQTAEKGRSWVASKPIRANRIQKILKTLPISLVGDFHSHTDLGALKAIVAPSKTDIADMEEGQVYLIMAVNNGSRHQQWRMNGDGTISGSLNSYHVKIGAVVSSKNGRWEFERAKIHCSFAMII